MGNSGTPPCHRVIYVVLGAGFTVMVGAIVGTEARLGVSSIVNCGTVLTTTQSLKTSATWV